MVAQSVSSLPPPGGRMSGGTRDHWVADKFAALYQRVQHTVVGPLSVILPVAVAVGLAHFAGVAEPVMVARNSSLTAVTFAEPPLLVKVAMVRPASAN
jgi:hypothetical protein